MPWVEHLAGAGIRSWKTWWLGRERVMREGGTGGGGERVAGNRRTYVGYGPWLFNALEKVEGGEGCGGVEARAVEGVHDKIGEGRV